MRSIIARRPKNRIADARTFTASTLAVATASKALSSLSKLCASIKTSSMPSLCALAATWATEGLVFDSARSRHSPCYRYHLNEKFEPFLVKLRAEYADPGDVAPWARNTSDKPCLLHVVYQCNDRD